MSSHLGNTVLFGIKIIFHLVLGDLLKVIPLHCYSVNNVTLITKNT